MPANEDGKMHSRAPSTRASVRGKSPILLGPQSCQPSGMCSQELTFDFAQLDRRFNGRWVDTPQFALDNNLWVVALKFESFFICDTCPPRNKRQSNTIRGTVHSCQVCPDMDFCARHAECLNDSSHVLIAHDSDRDSQDFAGYISMFLAPVRMLPFRDGKAGRASAGPAIRVQHVGWVFKTGDHEQTLGMRRHTSTRWLPDEQELGFTFCEEHPDDGRRRFFRCLPGHSQQLTVIQLHPLESPSCLSEQT